MQQFKLNNIILKIENLKKKQKTIGLCHGVFDILHSGHINHFLEAKKNCDFLIVSITPSQYVKKGIGRPFYGDDERLKAILNLKSVDFAFINLWETAENTILKLRPNFYFKGNDYINQQNDITKNLKKEISAITKVKGKFIITQSKLNSSSSLFNEKYDLNQKNFLKKVNNEIKDKYVFDIDQFKNKKVLIIGESIIDQYIFTEAIAKSGKDPILVNKIKSKLKIAGGILSVANNISNFVKKVDLVTYLGEFESETRFVKKKLSKNIKLNYFIKKNSPTIIKTRYIDEYSNSKLIGFYNINTDPISIDNEKYILKKIRNIKDYDTIIAIDYGHGLFTDRIIRTITKSKKLCVNVQKNSFNSSFYRFDHFNKAFLISLQIGEFKFGLRQAGNIDNKLIEQFYNSNKYKFLSITHGKKGSQLYSSNHLVDCPAFTNEVKDRIGAGDNYFALLSLFLTNTSLINFSILAASIAASLSIQNFANIYKQKPEILFNSLKSLLK